MALRCGMSGEAAPRHIIRSQVMMKPYGEVSASQQCNVYVPPPFQVMDVWNPKYVNKEELYLILCRFLSDVYLTWVTELFLQSKFLSALLNFYRHLMVNPRDHRVVVIESILCPSNFRNTLARALFVNFSVNWFWYSNWCTSLPIHSLYLSLLPPSPLSLPLSISLSLSLSLPLSLPPHSL